jgi:hypothetical protein
MRQRFFRVALVMMFGAAFGVVRVTPAYAICSSDNTNSHTVGGVPHGWSRVFCQPSNDYTFTVWTNHGHGTKYVALVHAALEHTHCDNLATGSTNATCSRSGLNVHHASFHGTGSSCYDRYNDGHGFDCHVMEALP